MLLVVPQDDREAKFMRLALLQAEQALNCGEVPVGCVVVYAGGGDYECAVNSVIATGYNRTNVTCNVRSMSTSCQCRIFTCVCMYACIC
jgi:tRNA(Arg) A34 adenosine deaminase TadA